MPMVLTGRVMSVGLKDATPETKDRTAKESCVEVEVYVARKSTEIVQAPAHMLTTLQALEEEEHAFSVTYNSWAMGNNKGISFKLVKVLPVPVFDALAAA